MNILKSSVFIAISYMSFTTAYADTEHANEDKVIKLPTIQVLAEEELSEETGFIPFQEDKKTRQALQHQIYKMESDIQNTQVNDNTGIIIDYQPRIAPPDTTQVSPMLQQYILSIATEFQSPDPTNGLFKMLEPIGIDRSKALEGVQNREIKINMDDVLRFQQMIQDGIRNIQ